MKTGLIVGGILVAFFAILIAIAGVFISYSNEEIEYASLFKQKTDERTAFYDEMWKTISQKGKIAVKNDSSFRKNIELIMSNRKDVDGLMMKWVTESNPNANYDQVSALYKDLSRTVEAERKQFFEQEKMMQDIDLQHNRLIDKFPGSLILKTILGRKAFGYKPITSDRTDDAMKTGKDNNVDVF